MTVSFLSIISSCSGEIKDKCKVFRMGTFVYHNMKNTKDIKVIRNDSLQIEFDTELNISDTYYINWVDDCNYYLVIKESTNDSLMPFTKNDTLFTEIVEANDISYKYITRLHEHKREGILTILN